MSQGGSDGLTDKRGTTCSPHIRDYVTLAKNSREVGLGDVVNLLNTSGAKIYTVEGADLAIGDGGNDINKLVDSHGTGGGLNAGKGFGDAELVVLRGTANPVSQHAVWLGDDNLLGKTSAFPDSRVNLLNEGGKGTRLGIAEDRLKV